MSEFHYFRVQLNGTLSFGSAFTVSLLAAGNFQTFQLSRLVLSSHVLFFRQFDSFMKVNMDFISLTLTLVNFFHLN